MHVSVTVALHQLTKRGPEPKYVERHRHPRPALNLRPGMSLYGEEAGRRYAAGLFFVT